jgi:cytochrome c biogenesis factor
VIALGELSLWIALLMAVWGAAVSAAGGVFARDDLLTSADRGLLAATGFTALSAAGLWWALVSRDFALRYVAMYTSERVPLAYRVSAMWAGRAGSLFLWTLALAICCAIVLRGTRRIARARRSRVAAILGGVLALSLAFAAIVFNPFAGLSTVPANGRGLDPQLQDWTRILDAPLLTLGCSAALVWLVLSFPAPWKGGFKAARLRAAGPWPVVAFGALAAGTGLRLAWAYTHGGAVPSVAAFSQAPRGTAFAALVALLMAGVAFAAGPRRRIGVYLAATGVVALVAAAVANHNSKSYDVTLRDGETTQVIDAWGVQWTFTSQGASRIERPSYFLTSVALLPTRAGVRQRFITPELREFYDDLDRQRVVPDIAPGIRRSIAQDVYAIVPEVGEGSVVLRIRFNSLVSLAWVGGALVIAGVIAASFPSSSHRRGRA